MKFNSVTTNPGMGQVVTMVPNFFNFINVVGFKNKLLYPKCA